MMMKKYKDTKPNYAFIDEQNLHQSLREQNWELDYGKFRIYLKEKYNVKKAYIFIGYFPENQELYRMFRDSGYILKFKPVLHLEHGLKKGNVDSDMTLNIMRHYREYDSAVIITSDGDFDTTVRYLRRKGKLCLVLSPNFYKCSSLLKIQAQDKIDFMNNLRNKVEKNPFINKKAPLEDETSRSTFSS